MVRFDHECVAHDQLSDKHLVLSMCLVYLSVVVDELGSQHDRWLLCQLVVEEHHLLVLLQPPGEDAVTSGPPAILGCCIFHLSLCITN